MCIALFYSFGLVVLVSGVPVVLIPQSIPCLGDDDGIGRVVAVVSHLDWCPEKSGGWTQIWQQRGQSGDILAAFIGHAADAIAVKQRVGGLVGVFMWRCVDQGSVDNPAMGRQTSASPLFNFFGRQLLAQQQIGGQANRRSGCSGNGGGGLRVMTEEIGDRDHGFEDVCLQDR